MAHIIATKTHHRLLQRIGTQLPWRHLHLATTMTPAFYVMTLWILALSDGAMIERNGLPAMLAWALLVAFGASYALVLFLAEWERHRESERDNR